MKLTTLIKAWDLLHVDEVGDVTFNDLYDLFDLFDKQGGGPMYKVVNDLAQKPDDQRVPAGVATPAG